MENVKDAKGNGYCKKHLLDANVKIVKTFQPQSYKHVLYMGLTLLVGVSIMSKRP